LRGHSSIGVGVTNILPAHLASRSKTKSAIWERVMWNRKTAQNAQEVLGITLTICGLVFLAAIIPA
jgi:hypothetical protein